VPHAAVIVSGRRTRFSSAYIIKRRPRFFSAYIINTVAKTDMLVVLDYCK
jgi:hypothetical protein